MKNTNKIRTSLLMLVTLMLINSSCQKDNNNSISSPLFNSNVTYGSVTDYDGNLYKTVVIGTQTWIAENLRNTHYQNGESILEVRDTTTWINLSTGAYCDYNNSSSIVATYGRLYNWYAVKDSRNIAPNGWHVATEADWEVLTTYLGGESIAGGKLKEIGLTHWQSPNTGATNETGFTGLPGGFCFVDGVSFYMGSIARWWSSTKIDNTSAQGRVMAYNSGEFHIGSYSMLFGLSVRCVKD